MKVASQHADRKLIIGIILLMYTGASLFLVLRMNLPSDGTRLWVHQHELQPSPISVVPLNFVPTNLLATDNIIGVEGQPLTHWVDSLLTLDSSQPRWKFGQTVTYTVDRDGKTIDVPITLQQYPILGIIRKNMLTVLLLVGIEAAAVWLFVHRGDERAAHVLLLASSSLTAFSMYWFVGTDLVLLVNVGYLWLYYRFSTFSLLMIMCASLLHFTLLLTRKAPEVGLDRRTVISIYLVPYLLYILFLVMSYTPDKLVWITHWEQGIWLIMAGCFVIGLGVAWMKYWVADNKFVRRQLMILVSALVVTAILVVTVGWLPLLITRESNWEILPLVMLPIVFSLVMAIVFYRLFDFRIAIQRTLVWGALTTMIIVVYIVVVGALSILLNQRNDPVFALIATGVVAVLFHPVRERLQHTVNNIIYGDRDSPYKVIIGLTQRLEEALVPQVALDMIVETLCKALKLPYTAIELVENDHFIKVAEFGASNGVPATEYLSFLLKYADETIGRLLISPSIR
ncbi:MAG: hypothetical protein R3E39_27875 [Anaerolineae bacterium]